MSRYEYNELYKLTVKGQEIAIEETDKDSETWKLYRHMGRVRIVAEMPTYSKVSNNCGYAFGYPPKSNAIKQWVLEQKFSDGEYLMGMVHEYHNRGWSSGDNWYGLGIYVPRERRKCEEQPEPIEIEPCIYYPTGYEVYNDKDRTWQKEYVYTYPWDKSENFKLI